MMKIVALLLALISTCVFAASPEAVTIFGVPLGGKLKSMPRECPFSMIGTDKNKTLCWVGPPYIYPPTGTRMGSIQMPNGDKLPKWSAYALFSAHVTKSGVLEMLEVRSSDGKAGSEIEQSITSRFGTPTNSKLYGPGMHSAYWNRSDINIELLCNKRDLCMVTFMSPDAKANHDGELATQRKKEAERALSP